MEVPYVEGVAIHIGPEPCADACKGAGEASAGECAGQPLSRERPVILGADTVPNVEGHTHGRAISERLDGPAWSQTLEIKEEMRHRMHQPIPEQGRWLAQVVRGYFAYHAVPTNSASIGAFRHHVVALWRCSLSRRSQHGRITGQRIKQIADNWLPQPKILLPWPQQRFAVRHSR